MRIIVTGGAGFIGSAVVRYLVSETDATVINVDKLTYAGNLESLEPVAGSPRYCFEGVDICDAGEVSRIFTEHRPHAVMHLAAESHVDRSIDSPADFIQTNIIGTYVLVEAALRYWAELPPSKKDEFRFHHVSTDEVYGSLPKTGAFTEDSPYRPNSPYSASKAASDHLARAWHHTYGLPVVVSNCSNNYGAYQFPEKLIPLLILNALEGKPLPIYGRGDHVRDWLYVEDHAEALYLVLTAGTVGETYNIGGRSELTNLEVAHTLCGILEELAPQRPPAVTSYASLIAHVEDRPGHDQRYAMDIRKIQQHLRWTPRETFESGLRKTVGWYLANLEWCRRIQDGSYQRQRLGLANRLRG